MDSEIDSATSSDYQRAIEFFQASQEAESQEESLRWFELAIDAGYVWQEGPLPIALFGEWPTPTPPASPHAQSEQH
jgi:hypothetical protein